MTEKDFKDLDELLNASKDDSVQINDNTFDTIPDGTYNAYIKEVGFGVAKSSGNLKFTWEFVITDKPFENRREWKHQPLTSPENMKRLTTDLKKFGVDTLSRATIEKGLSDLLDVEIVLTINTSVPTDPNKTPYRNMNIKLPK